MFGFIIRALITAAGLGVATLLPIGVYAHSWKSLVGAALLLGIVNGIVRPILVILTFPITIVTLGLFLLVINGLMLGLVSLLPIGFHVHGLVSAILGAIVVGLTSWVASWFIGPSGRFERYQRR
ncbi:MAG TPA: phage holin family protein [Caulobacteraceae bacterium]|nr:phage holin family protein [Caulobacteraceae bacterium]